MTLKKLKVGSLESPNNMKNAIAYPPLYTIILPSFMAIFLY